MLFIMRGTSCSGKDTFISKFFTSDQENNNHIISSDNFRTILFGAPNVQRQNKVLFEFIHRVLEIRLQSHIEWTVYNATNLKPSDSSGVVELCKKYKTPYTFISIEPPSIDVLYERSVARAEHGGLFVPKHVLERHHESYHNCTKYFIEEAVNSKLCSFIEIDQYFGVLKNVN